MLLVVDADSRALEQLPRDECMRLMGSVPVGRIVYTRRALPAVEMVNFSLVEGDIVAVTDGAGQSDHFVRISPAMVNGRRVIGHRLTGSSNAHRF
jgi:hypothetical protein